MGSAWRSNCVQTRGRRPELRVVEGARYPHLTAGALTLVAALARRSFRGAVDDDGARHGAVRPDRDDEHADKRHHGAERHPEIEMVVA